MELQACNPPGARFTFLLQGAELDKRRRKIRDKIEKEFGLTEQVDKENTNLKVKSRTQVRAPASEDTMHPSVLFRH